MEFFGYEDVPKEMITRIVEEHKKEAVASNFLDVQGKKLQASSLTPTCPLRKLRPTMNMATLLSLSRKYGSPMNQPPIWELERNLHVYIDPEISGGTPPYLP